MSDYTKSNIGSGYNAATNINTELGKIETAIASKVDEEGGVMTGDLQMNSNDILNAGQVSTNTLILDGVALTANNPVNSDTTITTTRIVATAGQTVFTVPSYSLGINAIQVFLNGVKLSAATDYAETDTTTITLTDGASEDDVFEALIGATVTDANNYDSALVTYTQGSTGSVATNVEAKLQETVSVKDFGAVGDGATDDTAAIQAAFNSGATEVVFPEGTFLVVEDTIEMPNGVSATGSGTVRCDVSSAAGINNHSHAMLVVSKNNSIRGLSFLGTGNNCYGVGGFSDASNDCDNITVEGCFATECGIATFEPFDGFSFNRYDEAFIDWYNSGQVTSVNKGTNITVRDCVMYGDTTYSSATSNTNNAKVSGVSLMFCENADVSNIKVYNARFGVWSYGGSPKNSGNTDLNGNTNESKNIRFSSIFAKDIYSAAWMSNTDDGTITNCEANNFEDVQIDFEGCNNCIGSHNICFDSDGKGQALGALNGCNNIIFSNNIIKSAKSASTSLCRDGNSNISFINNILESTEGASAATIKIWNALTGLTTNNSRIVISGNTMINYDVDAQIVEGVTVDGNKISGIARAGVLTATDCDKVTFTNNTINFSTDYTDATATGSPIQVLQGSGTLDHTATVVCNNKIFDCTDKSGIYIQIALTASPLNDVKVTGNIANCIWAADSWINTPVNGTKGRFVDRDNYSNLADTDHTLASVVSRSNGTERFNPSIMYGGTGIGSLSGTFKVGDVIWRTTPTASGTMGWVCTTAGTPGTWKTFGNISA